MDARAFVKEHGWKEAERVAIKAGTTKGYFALIAYEKRNASLPLAERLVDASDGRLDLMSLMTAARKRSAA